MTNFDQILWLVYTTTRRSIRSRSTQLNFRIRESSRTVVENKKKLGRSIWINKLQFLTKFQHSRLNYSLTKFFFFSNP